MKSTVGGNPLFYILALSLFMSCSDRDDTIHVICGVNDPTEELAWLKAEITIRRRDVSEEAKYQYISQAVWEGSTVFLYRNCDPKGNSIIPVYSCEGELLGEIGKNFVLDDFSNLLILFKPLDFVCD